MLKNYFKLLLIIVLCMAVAWLLPLNSFGNIITVKDKRYDDWGKGDIKYPSGKEYSKKGIFDITKFNVKSAKNNYIFGYSISNLSKSDTIKSKYNFSYILLDTYISTGENGMVNTLKYGAVVDFDKNHPWKYHIRITPDSCYMEIVKQLKPLKVDKIMLTPMISKNIIEVSIDKKYIKENLKSAYYYVFSGGYDMFGADNYRKVQRKASPYYFSGGDDGYYSPHVIDVVNKNQESLLNSYLPPFCATLYPVFNLPVQIHLYKEYIEFLFAVFLGVITFNCLRKSHKKNAESLSLGSNIDKLA